jgi:hypothetical protein
MGNGRLFLKPGLPQHQASTRVLRGDDVRGIASRMLPSARARHFGAFGMLHPSFRSN